MPHFQGGCHCGDISVTLSTEKPISDLRPRACQCSFCRRHAAAMISDPGGEMNLATNSADTSPYRFGLGITDFHVCTRCGVFVAATWEDTNGDTLGVVNIHALSNTDVFMAPELISFEGESIQQREERRRRNWTPVKYR
jgi:hypothetical protein